MAEPLMWWLDRQVALTLADGRQCRAWVREIRRAIPASNRVTALADVGEGDNKDRKGPGAVSHGAIGQMTLTLFPEPPALDNPRSYPAEVTTPIYAGGDHGHPHAVRQLTETESLRARLRPRRPPTTTTMLAS